MLFFFCCCLRLLVYSLFSIDFGAKLSVLCWRMCCVLYVLFHYISHLMIVAFTIAFWYFMEYAVKLREMPRMFVNFSQYNNFMLLFLYYPNTRSTEAQGFGVEIIVVVRYCLCNSLSLQFSFRSIPFRSVSFSYSHYSSTKLGGGVFFLFLLFFLLYLTDKYTATAAAATKSTTIYPTNQTSWIACHIREKSWRGHSTEIITSILLWYIIAIVVLRAKQFCTLFIHFKKLCAAISLPIARMHCHCRF